MTSNWDRNPDAVQAEELASLLASEGDMEGATNMLRHANELENTNS